MKTTTVLAAEFLSYIKSKNHQRVQLTSQDWLRLAIRASGGPGNPKGSCLTISATARNRIEQVIQRLIRDLKANPRPTEQAFDQYFVAAVREIVVVVNRMSPMTSFGFGRAQKILTIYFKYIVATSLKESAPALWIHRWSQYVHVPVDRQTLLFLLQVPRFRRLSLLPNGRFLSWKWTMDQQRYTEIQQAIRALSTSLSYENPLHLEMDLIWTQPVQSAGRK